MAVPAASALLIALICAVASTEAADKAEPVPLVQVVFYGWFIALSTWHIRLLLSITQHKVQGRLYAHIVQGSLTQ